MSDGQLISTAEGFVGEDEAVWFGGQVDNKSYPKRAEYAIRAMAQTRAISRACRSAFAHVVVMMNKGLATTPAEEVYDAETGEVFQNLGNGKVPGISKIKERLRELQEKGNAATDLETFNALVKERREDLKAIRDANHEWWTGDGGEVEGFGPWKDRRKAELTPQERSTSYQFLISCVDECTSINELNAFVAKHGEAVEMLDGEESRLFETFYGAKETALNALATAEA
jgi:hypothetical protein